MERTPLVGGDLREALGSEVTDAASAQAGERAGGPAAAPVPAEAVATLARGCAVRSPAVGDREALRFVAQRTGGAVAHRVITGLLHGER